MKNFLLSLILSIPVSLIAQNPVPNPGFENWTSGNPDDWTANNFGPGASPILQTSPGNSGSSAMKGEVIAVGPVSFFPIVSSTNASAQGFPVSQSYAALTFYYKTNILASTTTFNAFVDLLDASVTTVAGGIQRYNGVVSTFTLATIPIVYVSASPPTTGVVAFTIDDTTAVPNNGEYFIVDDVELTGSVGLEEMNATSLAIERVQPNPAFGYTTVYYSQPSNGDITFELVDVTGRVCRRIVMNGEIAGRHKTDLDVSGLTAGIYYLQMMSGQEKRMATVQVVN